MPCDQVLTYADVELGPAGWSTSCEQNRRCHGPHWLPPESEMVASFTSTGPAGGYRADVTTTCAQPDLPLRALLQADLTAMSKGEPLSSGHAARTLATALGPTQ